MYFPQITRKITAGLGLALMLTGFLIFYSLLTVATFLNYHTQLFPQNEEYMQLKLQTLKHPRFPADLVTLGTYLNEHGLTKEAAVYFQIAQTRYNSLSSENLTTQNILGEQTSPATFYETLMQQNQKIYDEIEFWQKVIIEKPQYRDAYLQMGLNFAKLGLFKEAKNSFEKAFALDPFYPQRKLIEKQYF